VTAEVLAFPKKHVELADTEEDLHGPPGHIDAWVCLPCDEDPEVNPYGKFCFYVTREGVHCWTCHAVQYFT
jgi:hypothetical protein